MVKISIQIEALHPAIVSRCVEVGADPVKVLEAVNDAIAAATEPSESTGNIRAKSGKDSVTVSASGKLSGVKFDKESIPGLLARVHWYLEGSRELYTRIQEVQLPSSVMGWLAANKFKAEPATA